MTVILLSRKASNRCNNKSTVPQTDTGSQEENSKVYERIVAKELGKIAL